MVCISQEDGFLQLQMDFCEGGSLAGNLKKHGAMPEQRLWGVAAQIGAGLAFLHQHGVLHLDIKPENVYLTNTGVCRIGDFGLALRPLALLLSQQRLSLSTGLKSR